ncbi:MAG: hypothetical protein V1744_02295 [Candidatus Altiarchaeota archaeon]
MNVYQVIDRFPEFPYFVLAVVFISLNPVDVSLHVLAVSFLFMVSSLIVGIVLKFILKTNRPTGYKCIILARYDVPSLHSLLSVGGAVFVYFVSPIYCVFAVPLAILYMHSRIKLCLHTTEAVVAGAIIGFLMGVLFGLILWSVDLDGFELILSLLFFFIPVFVTIFDLRYFKQRQLIK